MKRGKIIGLFFICSILLIGLGSAGLLDSIRDALTGHATTQPTNVSVTVAGINATTVGPVDNSTLTGGVNPTEGNDANASIYTTVCDPDGVNDINDSSVSVEANRTGETIRYGSCAVVSDLDANCANYSCSVDMWYWDESGAWTLNITANDLGNGTLQTNNSQSFTYNLLKALVISPDQINWTSITPGGTNESADNDPTVVNNTGNYNGSLNITGYDLYGAVITTERFAVENFTADPTDPACGGTSLVNATTEEITGTSANRGNLTSGGGTEDLYYCIPSVPLVSSQEYTTDVSGSWIIAY